MNLHLVTADWLALLSHFLSLSLLAIGGAIGTSPDMHRFLVDDKHWLTQTQFSSSITLAQAAPGPNVLFIALLGWNVGLNAGGGMGAGTHAWGWALLGMLICMVGILLPSSLLTLTAARWGHQNRELRSVRAFKQGMAPVVIGLLLATGWVLNPAQGRFGPEWKVWLLTLVATLLVWRTKIHLLWMLGAGALLGALGWV